MKTNNFTYDELHRHFEWKIPEFYNIGFDVSEKWAIKTPDNPAIVEVLSDGTVQKTSYSKFDSLVNKGANYLSKMGVAQGDRLGILLPQTLDCAIAHVIAF